MSRTTSRPRIAGRYAYAGEEGTGAFGRVLRLEDTWHRGALRAGKVVPSAESERLRWEFERLRSVRSPFLVEAFDLLRIGESLPPPFSIPAGSTVLVESWVEGPSAAEFLSDAVDVGERARRLARLGQQLARALSALHAVGLVHGDVSPANVRVLAGDGDGGRAVLLDLGASGPAGIVQVASGTPGFMAPEVWSGERSPRSDLFALGATLAACWQGGDGLARSSEAGRHQSSDVSRALAAALQARDAWLARSTGLPSVLREEIGRMLHPDPWRRPPDAEGVADRFAAWLGEGTPARDRLRKRGEEARSLRPPLVGRAEAARALSRLLRREGVALVVGVPGSGRSRLVSEAVARWQRRLVAAGKVPPTFARWNGGFPEEPPRADAIWWIEHASERDVQHAARRVLAARLQGVRLTALLELVESPKGSAWPVVRLGPLEAEAFERLVRDALGRSPPSSWLRAVYASCDGLPGRFVRRLQRLLREGEEPLRPGSWSRMHEALHFEEASATAHAFAERFAVAGDVLPLETLPDDEQVAELFARGWLLLHEGEARLRTDIGEALRAAMSIGQVRLRARQVEAAASRGGAFTRAFVAWSFRDASADALGAEAVTARLRQGRPEEAARWGERLIRWAERVGVSAPRRTRLACAEAWRAAGDYEQALSCMEGVDEGEPVRVRRAELLRLAGRSEEALEVLAPLGHPLARVVEARVRFDQGRWKEAEQLLATLFEADGVPQASEVRIRAHEVLALLALFRGDAARAVAEADAAKRAAADAEVPLRVRAEGLSAMVAMRVGGSTETGIATMEQAAERAEACGERHAAASFRVNAALGRLSRGEVGHALRGLEEGGRLLAAMGRDTELGRALLALCSARALAGDLDGAREALETIDALDVGGDADLRLLAAVASLETWVARRLPAPGSGASPPTTWRGVSRAARGASETARALAWGRVALLAGRSGWSSLWRTLRRRWRALPASVREGGAAVDWCLGRAWVDIGRGAFDRAEASLRGARERLRSGGADLAERRWQIAVCSAWLAEARGAPADEAWAEARAWVESVIEGLDPAERLRLRSLPLVSRALRRGAGGAGHRRAAERQGWEVVARSMRAMVGSAPGRRAVVLLRAALAVTSSDRGALLQREASGRWRLLRALRADGALLDAEGFPVSTTLLGRAWREGATWVTVDAGSDESLRSAGSVHRAALRSVLVVPMPRWAQHGGALVLDDRLRAGAFSPEEVQQVELLASTFERLPGEGAGGPNGEEGDRPGEGEETIHLVARSAAMRELLRTAAKVARSDAPVLLTGESGTGKELLARWIHAEGERAGGPFVAVHCATLGAELAESRLFGHAAGAFTGADRAREGLIEVASGGTLLLDDLEELPGAVQAALLRVLQSGEYRRLGEVETRRADVRVIVTSRRDLREEVEGGRLRRDLFHRLAVLTLRLPPLRERPEDVEPLVRHFLRLHGEDAPLRITEEAWTMLRTHHWPGNVRELESEVRRWAALGFRTVDATVLASVSEGRSPSSEPPGGKGLRARLEAHERHLLEEALVEAGGNVSRAARQLGMSRYGLQKAMKRLGVRR